MTLYLTHYLHRSTASPVPSQSLAITLGEALTSSGSFHWTSHSHNSLPWLPMKTYFGVISGQMQETSKEKICSTESVNRQGSLDSSKEDDNATLVLIFTLCNVKKTELSKAARVFEVQNPLFTSYSLPPLTVHYSSTTVPIASTSPILHLPLYHISLSPCVCSWPISPPALLLPSCSCCATAAQGAWLISLDG